MSLILILLNCSCNVKVIHTKVKRFRRRRRKLMILNFITNNKIILQDYLKVNLVFLNRITLISLYLN